MQFIKESMDEAKLTANKEAKRIVIQTIQRVATEHAIENAVTVFHIDNDEVKGRVIDVKDEISERWKQLPELRSLLMTLLKQLSFPALIRFVVSSPVWHFTKNLSPTDVFTRHVLKK